MKKRGIKITLKLNKVPSKANKRDTSIDVRNTFQPIEQSKTIAKEQSQNIPINTKAVESNSKLNLPKLDGKKSKLKKQHIKNSNSAEPSESDLKSDLGTVNQNKGNEGESYDKSYLNEMKSFGVPSESSQSKTALRSLKSKKPKNIKMDQVMNMINEVLNKSNENKARIEAFETSLKETLIKDFNEFKLGMAEDMIAIEKKINRNFEFYKKDTVKFRDRLTQKFKDFKKKIDDNHDLVLKRFAKEKYSETKISPKRVRVVSDMENEKSKVELHNSLSKERIDGNITNINEEIDKMRDMMRRLSLLTSKEIDGLKDEFESFKKHTSADVKMAKKEVEAHERELARQQEMYRSMLTEYYSALETRKTIDYNNLKISADIGNQTTNELKSQTMNISHINIGNIHINKGIKPKISNSKALNYGKTSKSDIKSEFPKIHVQPSKVSMVSSVNFSPSIRNQSEMRNTMKGILNTEEKQYEVLRRFVKQSSKKSVNRTINISPSEFRPSLISLQLAANINESKLTSSISDNEKSGVFKVIEGPL